MISNKNTLIISSNSNDLSMKAADSFVHIAERSIKEKGSFNVALSGGTTPKALYESLSKEEFRNKINWNQVHLFWGDERGVPPEHVDSNYRMAREFLISRVNIPESNIHRIEAEKGEEAATLYNRELRETISIKKDDFPAFDLIILGVGTDGHTASLFPESDALNEKENAVKYVYVKKLDSNRITITPPVIYNASNIFILASGKEKAQIIKKLQLEESSVAHYPVLLVNNCSGHVTWFLDKDSSEKISAILS